MFRSILSVLVSTNHINTSITSCLTCSRDVQDLKLKQPAGSSDLAFSCFLSPSGPTLKHATFTSLFIILHDIRI